MRALLLSAALLAVVMACEHGKSPCLTCPDAGVSDANAGACAPSGGCMTGPMCFGQCCAQGESCVAGKCTCGTNMACTNGNICASGGPIGGDSCGTICCGSTSPCPLVAP